MRRACCGPRRARIFCRLPLSCTTIAAITNNVSPARGQLVNLPNRIVNTGNDLAPINIRMTNCDFQITKSARLLGWLTKGPITDLAHPAPAYRRKSGRRGQEGQPAFINVMTQPRARRMFMRFVCCLAAPVFELLLAMFGASAGGSAPLLA